MSITVLALNAVFTVYIVSLMYLIPRVGPRDRGGPCRVNIRHSASMVINHV